MSDARDNSRAFSVVRRSVFLACVLAWSVCAQGREFTMPQGPAAIRIKALAPFFKPAPGQIVRIDPREKDRNDPGLIRGYITVTPPRGTCFTIRLQQHRRDQIVCHKTALSFHLAELDEGGRIFWQVSTGDGDFGTRLSWPTPYRIGRANVIGTKLGDPYGPIYLASCTKLAHRRALKIELFAPRPSLTDPRSAPIRQWTIAFPATDTLMPQPKSPPNLWVAESLKKGISAAPEPAQEKDANPSPTPEKSEAPPPVKTPAPAKKTTDPNVITDSWIIPERGSFVMPAGGFHASDAPAVPGGSCRYQLSGAADDPKSGWIECHDTDEYDFVFAHLTCASALAPSEATPP